VCELHHLRPPTEDATEDAEESDANAGDWLLFRWED